MTAKISGGGSLLIAWQLKGKTVLIVGGGEVASQRVDSILVTDARITIISPNAGLHPRTKQLIEENNERITHYDRLFLGPEELNGMDMVLTALDDVELSRAICEMSRKARIPVNAADIPDSCDFYFGSQIRDGPLQIMISTNGNGPRMAHLIRRKIEGALSGVEGEAIIKVGQLREQLKTRSPGVGGAVGRKRMKWMTSLCNAWRIEELALLDNEMMKRLLDEGWEKDFVPTFAEIGGSFQSSSTSILSTPSGAFPAVIGFVAGALCATLIFMSRRR